MDFLDILREKAFLGREFLTWLWFKSEQTGGSIEIEGGKVIEVVFHDRMTLDLTDVDTPQIVTIKGEFSELREGLAAIREGKKIEEARISIKNSDNEFSMIIKGSWFSFGSLRTPRTAPIEEGGEEDTEAAFLEKMGLIEEGMGLIDSLFERFVKIRTSESWNIEEIPKIRKWAS
jgi:recombination associated protein RdgC